MTLPFFIGVLTLAPAVLALLVLLAALLRIARLPVIAILATVGALIPAICLPFFTPILKNGELIRILPPFGDAHVETAWFTPAYRIDAFGVFAAYGIVFLVAPLLLWMAFHGESATVEAVEVEAVEAADGEEEVAATAVPRRLGLFERRLGGVQWGGVALALAVESAALTVVFADNILWLTLAWLLLVIFAWGLGEMGSDWQTLDRVGLGFMIAGPILWVLTFLLPAITKQRPQSIYPTISDTAGRGTAGAGFVIAVAVALAVAAGVYPFSVWVRRRAALITPAGLAVIAMLLLPLTLFVGGRTYSALQDSTSFWPQIGAAQPPITAGVAFALLGGLAVALSGFLALGRRDSRSLIAFLAIAQAGWGMFALGTGSPAGALGLTLLLASAVLGIGAMLAALYAGGTLLSDVEPETTGPRALGAPLRPLHLAAWSVGALTLVGAPLFAGFPARQLASMGAVESHGLTVPLLALAWIGDGLLLLALLRATAPAFARLGADMTPRERRPDLPGLVAALYGLLALAAAVAPQALFALGGVLAAGALVQFGTTDLAAQTLPLGYSAAGAQWMPTLGWIGLVMLGALFAFLLQGRARARRPLVLAGQAVASAEEEERAQAEGLADPVAAWSDLSSGFSSFWAMPGGSQLLRDLEDDATEDEADDETEDDENIVGEDDDYDELDEMVVEGDGEEDGDLETVDADEDEDIADLVGEDEAADGDGAEGAKAAEMSEVSTEGEVSTDEDAGQGEAGAFNAAAAPEVDDVAPVEADHAEEPPQAPTTPTPRVNGNGARPVASRPRGTRDGKRSGRKGGR